VTVGRSNLPVLEFEVVGVAVGAALVSGALSLVAPYLASLTAALAALALAGWVVRWGTSASGERRSPLRRMEWLALGCLALGGALFLSGAPPVLSVRGLVLVVSVVPLWAATRTLPARSA